MQERPRCAGRQATSPPRPSCRPPRQKEQRRGRASATPLSRLSSVVSMSAPQPRTVTIQVTGGSRRPAPYAHALAGRRDDRSLLLRRALGAGAAAAGTAARGIRAGAAGAAGPFVLLRVMRL